MNPPESGDEKRREIIRRLEDEDQRADAELTKAQAKKISLQARLLRAKGPYDSATFCFMCWVNDGIHSKLHPQSSGRGVDIFRCGECGNIEQRPS